MTSATCLREEPSLPAHSPHLKRGSYSWFWQVSGRVGTDCQAAVIIIANIYVFVQQTVIGHVFVCTSVSQDVPAMNKKILIFMEHITY